MDDDRQGQKIKALFAASLTAAAAVVAAGLNLAPRAFAPLPLWIGGVALAALAGAVSSGTHGRKAEAFVLLAPILPVFRLALLLWEHGLPPWPVRGWGWVTGHGYGWWAVGFLTAAGLAGVMAAAYAGIMPRENHGEGEAKRRWHERDPVIVAAAGKGHAVVNGSFLAAAVLLAVLFTLRGRVGQGWPVTACLMVFLACGTYLVGLTQGRRLTATWREERIAIAPGTERRWWSAHAGYVWPALLFFAFLPGGFFVIDPRLLIPKLLVRLGLNTQGSLPVPPPMIRSQPGAGNDYPILAFFYLALGLLGILTALAVGSFTLFLILRFLVLRVLPQWAKSLLPLWRACLRFLAALGRLAHRAAATGARFIRLAGIRAKTRKGHGSHPPSRRARTWPASKLRRLFARLVLWGRERGYHLRLSATPREIGEGLTALLPDQRADLDLLVQGYEHERYGERTPNREELKRYEEAWKRTVRRGQAAGEEDEG